MKPFRQTMVDDGNIINFSDGTKYAMKQAGNKKRYYDTGRVNDKGEPLYMVMQGGVTFVRTSPRASEIRRQRKRAFN